jgi:uncharacterized protein YeaO (DUF488 family)
LGGLGYSRLGGSIRRNPRVTTSRIQLKRVYEPVAASDGLRILVERLWPRGVSKEKAQVDHWCKEMAPSTKLRQWYGHQVERWPAFRQQYLQELEGNPAGIAELRQLCAGKTVTFVFASRDEAHNSAVVLKDFLESME